MKLIEILRIISWSDEIIVIRDDNEIYEGKNNVSPDGGAKYCILMSCYDDHKVKRITFSDSRKAILIYID